MAHFVTRLEGFEGGSTNDAGGVGMSLDATVGTPEIVAEAARSGDYGLKLTPGVNAGTETATIALAYNAGLGGAADLTTDVDYAIIRVYIRVPTLPTTGNAELFTVQDSGAFVVHRVNIRTDGKIELAGVAGTTVLSTGSFYRFELKNDSADTTVLRLGGVQELTAPAGDLVNRLVLGKSSATGGNGGYTAYYDDIEIESSPDDIADIDYPGAGRVKRFDVDGDGALDGSWTSTTDPNLYQSVGIPDNGDTNRALSTLTATNQTCTIESSASAGVVSPITAVQFVSVAKQISLTVDGLSLLMRKAGVNQVLTAPAALTTSYKAYGYCTTVSPFTAAVYTTAELDALEVGHSMAAIS